MAKRQDSGSNSAHQNQRPTSHNEDAVPEMIEDNRGRATEADEEEEFEEAEDLDEEEDVGEEGTY
jgi:hypothetical protein